MARSRRDAEETLCPVARSTALVGDRWTLLIVRELLAGTRRFDELQAQTGATAQALSARLKRLEADDLIERRIYSHRPVRHEYFLTAMGADLYPVILALRAWGERWCKGADEPVAVRITHRRCGSEVSSAGTCPTCREPLARSELESEHHPAWAAERRRKHEEFRARSKKTP
jgi:DNA-binding HxlR family transcriptional regulator